MVARIANPMESVMAWGSRPHLSARYKINMKFNINSIYLDTISCRELRNIYVNKEPPSEEELVKLLKGEGNVEIWTTIDHPEFTKLREELGRLGYITIERRWWNGDLVTKPFTLNGKKFKKNDTFMSASAMKWYLKY